MNSNKHQQRLTFGLAVFVFDSQHFKKAKKSRPKRAAKGKFGELFSECTDYPQR